MSRRAASELFVSRLSFYVTTGELERLFSPFGVVKEVRLIRDPRTQRPKGFGFVKFESEIDAQNALKALNGTLFLNLEDVEYEKAGNQVAKFIINICDLAHDVEDIWDTYFQKSDPTASGAVSFSKHESCDPCYGVTANNFALVIKTIKKR